MCGLRLLDNLEDKMNDAQNAYDQFNEALPGLGDCARTDPILGPDTWQTLCFVIYVEERNSATFRLGEL